jgi:hypothetical protein
MIFNVERLSALSLGSGTRWTYQFSSLFTTLFWRFFAGKSGENSSNKTEKN